MENIKSSFLFFTLAILPACSLLESDIKEINSIQEVKSVFEQATQDDLFVFDIDQVLLEPEDIPLQPRFYENPKLKKIFDDFDTFIKTKNNSEEYRKLTFSKSMLQCKIQPIEKALIDNILAIKKRNIKVIAFTAYHTGKFGLIERLEEWRYELLLSLGLDFSASFVPKEIMFDELQKTEHAVKYKYEKRCDPSPTIFYKGIICTLFPKGVALKAFLEKIKYKPKCVYFFDDKPKNVESVVEEMKKMGIRCQGFVYQAATINRSAGDLDIEIAQLKYELMKQREDYVSYFEAKRILAQRLKMDNKNKLKPTQGTP